MICYKKLIINIYVKYKLVLNIKSPRTIKLATSDIKGGNKNNNYELTSP